LKVVKRLERRLLVNLLNTRYWNVFSWISIEVHGKVYVCLLMLTKYLRGDIVMFKLTMFQMSIYTRRVFLRSEATLVNSMYIDNKTNYGLCQ